MRLDDTCRHDKVVHCVCVDCILLCIFVQIILIQTALKRISGIILKVFCPIFKRDIVIFLCKVLAIVTACFLAIKKVGIFFVT